MELGLEIARLVIDSRGDSECSEQMLKKAHEIIETSSLLSIHTFTILDGLFLKNAVRSYLHFSQLNSGLTCSEEQLSDDAVYKYRISLNSVCLSDQLRNFEIHEFPLGRLNLLFCVYVTVKWKKYHGSSHLSSCSESAGSFSDEWLLLSQVLSGESHFTASSSEIPFFYKPTEYQQNNQMEKIESEDAEKAKDKKMLLGNEQIIKSSVVESLLSPGSSKEIEFPPQAVPPSLSSRRETLPRRSLIASAFRFMSTASKAFSKSTGLPLNSSPAPFSRNETKFVEDQPVKDTRNRVLEKTAREGARTHFLLKVRDEKNNNPSYYGSGFIKKNTTSSNGLLCNFEESALNGRLDLVTSLDGFHLQIAASDETCSPHLSLPVTTFFFNMPEDEAPLPYMGFCSLEKMRKGYRIPRKGILQAVLFNPQGTVVRMFLVKFDVSDMPPSSQTFLRQRTFFMPVGCSYDVVLHSWLKYLIHLSLATDRRGRLYVHSDIKMLFSQKNELETLNFDLGKDMIKYQLQSFTEMPRNPKYSPRK
ncbi:hypothetical protein X798_00405 [Onchocerca flexuosa]|uniref:Atos-like conserved domain-containing protein n=1 Tax=Onchocerca flexuosa TaxID=387005 RepID=A0A238C5Q3_9BILA|nr:hypothetical protein X798_00405 [Onchocerca flexuosa]